jgi:hypothetical protein
MRLMMSMHVAALLLAAAPVGAAVASDPETTVVPTGAIRVQQGPQELSCPLPNGPTGALAQPLLFIAAEPWLPIAPAASAPDGERPPEAEDAPKEQVPATLTFTVAGRELPAWTLKKPPTAYVLGLGCTQADPARGAGRVALTTNLTSPADSVDVVVMGMPDLALLGPSAAGPLDDLAQTAADPEARAYLEALIKEIAGERAAARDAYNALRGAKNELVARLARRALRMAAYQSRPHALSGNYLEHFRWGLYLQQCGLFSPAFTEFEEGRIVRPGEGECQFRAGESYDRLGGGVFRVLPYMDRAFETAPAAQVSDWYVLVVILKSRGPAVLTSEQVRDLKDQWLLAEKMTLAATGGRLRPITSFFDVENERQENYVLREDGSCVPADDIVQRRGWFDGVISVVPRLPEEGGKPARTFGGDDGLNGAALSCLYAEATWEDFLGAFYDQLSWTTAAAGLGQGIPLGGQAIACGHQPTPSKGHAYRAALHYHFSPAFFRRLKVADLPAPGSYAPLWEIAGPYSATEAAPTDATPRLHIVSEQDFIDLAKLFPQAGPARVQATTWVYSPEDQEVRLWLGVNDSLAAWVNGRPVSAAPLRPGGTYADVNLVDTIASFAQLKQGWNEIRLAVESSPAPHDKGWGFAVRFCTWGNSPVLGLAYLNEKPSADLVPAYQPPPPGAHYVWPEVRFDDFRVALPRLGSAELAAITGVQGLQFRAQVDGLNGHAAVVAPGRPDSATYRNLTSPWKSAADRDIVLNNVLDWSRESCAAFRYQKDGKDRDLLIFKLEASEAFLTLLNEPASAAALFAGRKPRDRLLGYLVCPTGEDQPLTSDVKGQSASWTLLVVDALLSDKDDPARSAWPTDEEDLLTPFGEYIPNSSLDPMGPPAPMM